MAIYALFRRMKCVSNSDIVKNSDVKGGDNGIPRTLLKAGILAARVKAPKMVTD